MMKEEKPKPVPDRVRSSKHSGFKKKSGKANIPSGDTDFFRCILFQIGKDRPNLFEKIIDCLVLYASRQFKKCSDVVVCLWFKEYVRPVAPIMSNNRTDMGLQNEQPTKDGADPTWNSLRPIHCTYDTI